MSRILIDWDKEADVVYVLEQGFDADDLIHIDSDKHPGIVKRIDPETDRCVGFVFESFTHFFPAHKDCDVSTLSDLMQRSLDLTNQAMKSERVTEPCRDYEPSKAELPLTAA